MRRHHAGRDDRGDQSETIRRRRDVPIGEPRPVMRPRAPASSFATWPGRDSGRDADRRRRAGCAFRRSPEDLFRLSTKWRLSSVAFSSRPNVTCHPSACASARRAESDRRDDLADPSASGSPGTTTCGRRAASRNARVSGTARRSAPVSGQLVERLQGDGGRTAQELSSWPAPDSRRQEKELEAAMDREERRRDSRSHETCRRASDRAAHVAERRSRGRSRSQRAGSAPAARQDGRATARARRTADRG